jgi:hypothetical protein
MEIRALHEGWLGFHWSMIISTGMRAPQMQHWQLVA